MVEPANPSEVMNEAERARRAEIHAGNLASILDLVLRCYCQPEEETTARVALDAWSEHRARLDAQGVPR